MFAFLFSLILLVLPREDLDEPQTKVIRRDLPNITKVVDSQLSPSVHVGLGL